MFCSDVVCRSRINVMVLQLLEKEDLQKLQKKWWYDKGQCVVESDNKVSTVDSCTRAITITITITLFEYATSVHRVK